VSAGTFEQLKVVALGYFALAVIFGNGQCRVKVAVGEVSCVKNLFSISIGAGSHRRVIGKKAVIPEFSQEILMG